MNLLNIFKKKEKPVQIEKVELRCYGRLTLSVSIEKFGDWLTNGEVYFYNLRAKYDANVFFNNKKYNIKGSTKLLSSDKERIAYAMAIDYMKGGHDVVKKVENKIKVDIVEKLDKLLEENRIKELKDEFGDMGDISFQFVFETPKTENM